MRGECEQLGKYAKLAILASITEPKSLSELGMYWYKENGRFYKKKARQEIEQAIENNLLVKKGRKYKTNTEKLISHIYSNIRDKDLKERICRFWCQPFSQKTYLCCEAIKHMFNNNPEQAARAKLSLILNTPLVLHHLQEKDLEAYSLFVSLQGLESYTNTINIGAEKNIPAAFKNLKEKTDWLNNLNKIIKNDGYLLNQTNHEIKIMNRMIRKRIK